MGDILQFFSDIVPKIGVAQAILLLVVASLIFIIVGYSMSIMARKEKMMNRVIDEQSKYSQQSADSVKVAITEIKELSIMSMTEIKGLSSQIGAFINLATTLIAKNNQPPGGGDSA